MYVTKGVPYIFVQIGAYAAASRMLPQTASEIPIRGVIDNNIHTLPPVCDIPLYDLLGVFVVVVWIGVMLLLTMVTIFVKKLWVAKLPTYIYL